MQRPRRASRPNRTIESYDHRDKERLNNPPVGFVTPETDRDAGPGPATPMGGQGRTHLFRGARSVSLHLHEYIDPRTIIGATRKHRHLMWRVV